REHEGSVHVGASVTVSIACLQRGAARALPRERYPSPRPVVRQPGFGVARGTSAQHQAGCRRRRSPSHLIPFQPHDRAIFSVTARYSTGSPMYSSLTERMSAAAMTWFWAERLDLSIGLVRRVGPPSAFRTLST